MSNITIKEIAQLCGVGVSTVSRAINNHPDVNEETKNHILEVIRENHYVPNNSARNLKRIVSENIAVLIKGITNPFFSPMISVFESEIPKKKYNFILQRVEEGQDEIDVALELEKEKRLRGIIFLGGNFSHNNEKLDQLSVPYVLSTVGMPHDEMQKEVSGDCSYVAVDDYAESFKMVDYLCELGHKRIAILCAPQTDTSISKMRYEGYMAALKANGIQPQEEWVRTLEDKDGRYSLANGYKVMTKMLEEQVECTAVYAISDTVAIGACKALSDFGKRVPEEVSVAGFDGIDIAQYYQPGITTIEQPVTEIAKETVRILFRLINKKCVREQKIFPGRLIVRDSTRKIT